MQLQLENTVSPGCLENLQAFSIGRPLSATKGGILLTRLESFRKSSSHKLGRGNVAIVIQRPTSETIKDTDLGLWR